MFANRFKLRFGYLSLAVGLAVGAGTSVSRALTTDEFNGAAGAPNSAVWNTVLGGSPANSIALNGAGALTITADTNADLNTCSSYNYQAPFLWQKVQPGEAWSVEVKYLRPAPGATNNYQWLQNIGIVGLAGTGSGASTDATQVIQYAWNTGDTTIGAPGAQVWNFLTNSPTIYFRLSDDVHGQLTPSFSADGTTFTPIGNYTQPDLYGIGLYAINYYSADPTNGTLFAAQYDYFRVLSDTPPVPEPASLGLLGCGGVGLLLRRRRR